MEAVFITGSLAFIWVIDQRALERTTQSKFDQSYANVKDALVGNLMLSHEQLLWDQMKELAEREKSEVVLELNHSVITQNPLSTDRKISRTYSVEYGGKIYGRLTLSRSQESFSSTNSRFILLLVVFQFVFFSGIVYLVYHWFLKSIVYPIEKLCSEDFKGKEILKDSWVPLEINEVREKLTMLWRQQLEHSKHLAHVEVSSQVAHDIRSPLAAIQMAITTLASEDPEGKRILIKKAVDRISDILNNLKSKNLLSSHTSLNSNAEPLSNQLLSDALESLVSEKRVQYRDKNDINIVTNLHIQYGIFSMIQVSQFKRVISNLIDNAIEAQVKSGTIMVSLNSDALWSKIEISDSGIGIRNHQLSELGVRGVSFGKINGSGLGLYHAKTAVTEWGGSLDIESSFGKGTVVRIKIPRSNPPKWFAQTLDIHEHESVVVLDDDPSIRSIWLTRLNPLKNIYQAQDVKEFLKLINEEGLHHKKTLFLCDYELIGSKMSGLDLIETFKIGKSSFLVTSYSDDIRLHDRCEALGVQLIPKTFLPFIPIRFRMTEIGFMP